MTTPIFIRDIPSYIRFTPAEAARKIKLLSRKIEDMGDQFSEAALAEHEIELTEAILRDRENAVREGSPIPKPVPTVAPASCTGLRPGKWPSEELPRVEFWTSEDTPILVLSDRWVLATDWELQWVLYRRKGKQWRAQVFPTSLGSLLWNLEHTDVSPEALATVRSWPKGHFSRWRTSICSHGNGAARANKNPEREQHDHIQRPKASQLV